MAGTGMPAASPAEKRERAVLRKRLERNDAKPFVFRLSRRLARPAIIDFLLRNSYS